MRQYHVTGMSCAACSARVEKAVNQVEGVTSCSVSLLTNSMGVEGQASDEAVIRAVQEAGYGCSAKGAEAASRPASQDEEALKDHETPVLKRRLFTSLGFLLVLMYVSMGHTMWGWPLPAFLAHNPLAIGLTQLLLTVIVMVINQKFFLSGFKSLCHQAPNMDTLVALGSSAAFCYSVYALFAMTADQPNAHSWLHEFYFESAAMILTLITVGKMLEARSKGKTTDALKSWHPRPPSWFARARRPRFPSSRYYRETCSWFAPARPSPWTGSFSKATALSTRPRLPARASPWTRQRATVSRRLR